MGYYNVPDDWGCWYSTCSRCGTRYHDSEGGCGCMDDYTECAGSTSRQECLVHDSDAIDWEGQTWCAKHLVCDGCGEPDGDEGEHLTPLEGDRYCRACMAEE